MRLPSFFHDIYSYNSIFYIEESLSKLTFLKKTLPNHGIYNLLSAFFIEITDNLTPIITEDSLKEIYEHMEELYKIVTLFKDFEKLLPVRVSNSSLLPSVLVLVGLSPLGVCSQPVWLVIT